MIKNTLLTIGIWSLFAVYSFGQSQISIATMNKLKSNAAAYKLVESDFNDLILTDEFTSTHNNITHLYFQQSKNGIPIFNATLTVAVNASGEIMHVGNRFEPLTDLQIISQTGLTDESAIQNVAQHLSISPPTGIRFNGEIEQKKIYHSERGSSENITIEPVLVKEGKKLILTKQVAIYSDELKQWRQVRVNAGSGNLVGQNSWTVECKWGSAHDCADHSKHSTNIQPTKIQPTKKTKAINYNPFMLNTYEVFALPLLNPDDGARSVVSAPWTNALNASPYGWHDTNGAVGAEYTITRGNNVYAVEDRNANDTPGYGPDGSNSLDFNFPLDLTENPVTYQDAAITNLFYWNNIIHDVMYQYGFDEASGNFQDNNYSNVSGGSDAVNADAQDGSSTNNATFSAPPDGTNPRMSMFEWTLSGSASDAMVNSPASVAGAYDVAVGQFGAQSGTFSGTLVEVTPFEGCTALTTPAAVNGNIALIDRGNCTFVDKVLNAQNAGAIATIICNNTNTDIFSMSGTDPSITIPAIMMSQADCATIRTGMPGVDFSVTLVEANLKDSDLDNGVIIHEYGHGISIRLTGGSANSSCLSNDEQMGEGWSDYLALVMTMKPGDVGPDPIGMGAYLSNEAPISNGIRTFPYSTNMTTNPLTYDDVKTASVPHGVGTVWATMLWDMTWDLINVYGFDPDIYNGTGGNNIALQLVIDGLKLQPCNPGFVDGRDAILAADQINNGGVNQCLIWEAFAKRGLGFSATQGSSASRGDGVEAFDVDMLCQPVLSFQKTGTAISKPNDLITYNLFVNNNTGNTLTNVSVTDPIPAGTSYVRGSLTTGTQVNGTINVTQSSMPTGTNFNAQFKVRPAPGTASQLVHYENFDATPLAWTATTGQGTESFTATNTNAYRTGAAFIANVGADNTQYLTSGNYALPANPVVSFWHYYDTESGWDGGYIEMSTNGGACWIDVGPYMISNEYNGGLGNSSNADIGGHPAFTGNSNGYIRTVADLAPFANQTVQFRFVFGSDNNTFSTGWYIDDFIIYEGAFVENVACVTTNQGHNICDSTSTLILPICEDFVLQQVDQDADGFGDAFATGFACPGTVGYSTTNTDCNDMNANIYPGAPDECDNVDNDCDGTVDEDCLACPVFLIISSHPEQTYQADVYIQSNTIVAPNDVIEYRAGQSIQLNPGFETQQGAYFDAIIQPCQGPKPSTETTIENQ